MKRNTTYLVWKDPFCDGVNPKLTEITGREFLALVRSPENKSRYFIRLPSQSDDGSDGDIVMESTEEQYRQWRKEKRHLQYLRDSNPGYTQVSYHAIKNADGCFGEEQLVDTNDELQKCIESLEFEAIRKSILRLSKEEQQMIEHLYLSEKAGTERGYSALTGVPQKTVHNRKIVALKKLKKFF